MSAKNYGIERPCFGMCILIYAKAIFLNLQTWYWTGHYNTLVYYGKYGTLHKTMAIFKQFWEFDLLWTKLCNYTEN